MSPSFTRDYPLVAKSGLAPWWKTLTEMFSGFRGGNRGVLDGALSPERGGSDSEAGCGTDSHVVRTILLWSLPLLAERLGKTVPGSEDKKVFFTTPGLKPWKAR
jgi:hypothetical protein